VKCKHGYISIKQIGLIVLLQAINLFVYSQVENNSIHNRINLNLNTNAHSTTANSTVEWSCISKKLTNKCLVYHNDQWFSFAPQQSGKYFLNISAQQCKKSQGIQLIIIEGDPCAVDTYKILNCIPKITQSDVFVELPSLGADKLYLINVDGFLGDFCEFDIQLSDKPQGMPFQYKSLDTLNLQSEQKNEIVTLRWTALPYQLDQLDYFEVNRLKSGEIKSKVLQNVFVGSNALGKYDEDYQYSDTLSAYGTYHYDILGVYKETGYRILLDGLQVTFKQELNVPKQFIARVPLSFAGKGKIEGDVINASNDQILTLIRYDYVYPETLGVNVTRFVKMGVKRFWIKIRNTKTKEFKQFTYQLNNNDELIFIAK
jgi:hypothetical protein